MGAFGGPNAQVAAALDFVFEAGNGVPLDCGLSVLVVDPGEGRGALGGKKIRKEKSEPDERR